jgi:hypothetical protein
MKEGTAPKLMSPAEFALLLTALRGASAYALYSTRSSDVHAIVIDVKTELEALEAEIGVHIVEHSRGAARLLHDFPSVTAEVLLIEAEGYEEPDWRLLDRRRSALAREGVTVFFTTPSSFDSLMRVAPNLASWLGGLVFEEEDERARIEEHRARRLAALRGWSGKTDDEVVREAERGELPRDPEYAEWLVLIGRGDLLDA